MISEIWTWLFLAAYATAVAGLLARRVRDVIGGPETWEKQISPWIWVGVHAVVHFGLALLVHFLIDGTTTQLVLLFVWAAVSTGWKILYAILHFTPVSNEVHRESVGSLGVWMVGVGASVVLGVATGVSFLHSSHVTGILVFIFMAIKLGVYGVHWYRNWGRIKPSEYMGAGRSAATRVAGVRSSALYGQQVAGGALSFRS